MLTGSLPSTGAYIPGNQSTGGHSKMEFVERELPLRELDAAWHAAASAGCFLLIAGEAGVGKTMLVEQFVRRQSARVYWGACDALFTPRPLGPLHDIALQANGNLARLLGVEARPAEIFAACLAELQSAPAIFVVEDIHWADEATLDLLKYLARRVHLTRSLLLVTMRDDELGLQHPLRLLLGDLATSPAVRRLTLAPLSLEGVRRLIGERPFDAESLHRQTGGNPFYVTEVLAADNQGVPPTVRDAVLARAARLSLSGRAVLNAAAVIGQRVEPWLLAEVTRAEAGAVDESLETGLLVAHGDVLAFRHELARQAILESMAPYQRTFLHQATLDALRESASTSREPARLAHHAEAAGDRSAVLEYAPVAARQASAASAHRQAARLYELALRYADDLDPAEHARLLEAYAQECNFVDQRAEGAGACARAIAIWRDLGEPLRQGAVLADMASMLVGLGKSGEAQRHAREAIALLEARPPGPELARAYRTKATLRFLKHDYEEAIAWAEKDITVSEKIGNMPEQLSARNIIGSARLFLDYERGCRYLERNLAAAHEAGRETTAAHAYTNLGSASCELYHLRRAERYLTAGMAYAAERDLDRLRLYMSAWWAMTLLRLGRWEEAVGVASEVLQRPGVSVPSRITALAALGIVQARQGLPEAEETLDEALVLAEPTGSLHRTGLVRAARAEAAWLTGDLRRAGEEARAVYGLAAGKCHPWFTGELAYWLWQAGEQLAVPAWAATPFAAQIAGDWQGAAAAWKRLGCPYEQARTLAGGDAAAQKEALLIFEQLGARPMAERVRAGLRAAGVQTIPRGPRAATRENPFGLTNRQLEILTLLTEGLTNAEIAGRLHISPKTVDHHVSAVLARLEVATREEAAALARRHPDF